MNIVVAACRNRGIGFKNNLPWKLSKDLKYFRFLTKDDSEQSCNAVIMGKNTCLSLPRALCIERRDAFKSTDSYS